ASTTTSYEDVFPPTLFETWASYARIPPRDVVPKVVARTSCSPLKPVATIFVQPVAVLPSVVTSASAILLPARPAACIHALVGPRRRTPLSDEPGVSVEET